MEKKIDAVDSVREINKRKGIKFHRISKEIIYNHN